MAQIKAGDKVKFLAISWDEPHWEFDHPTVVLKPLIRYSPNGEGCEGLIEELAIDICVEDVEDEDISEEFDWRKWKLSTLNKVAKERLEGKDTWKSKIIEVVKQTLEFYEGEDGLEFSVIETVTV